MTACKVCPRIALPIANIEKALLVLAEHVERCPFCDYKVAQEMMDLLGYVKLPTNVKRAWTRKEPTG